MQHASAYSPAAPTYTLTHTPLQLHGYCTEVVGGEGGEVNMMIKEARRSVGERQPASQDGKGHEEGGLTGGTHRGLD